MSCPRILLLLLPLLVSGDSENPVSRDLSGDPIPTGAITRLGTVRFRHAARVIDVAISPNGKLLASTGADKTIRVWNVADGQPRWSMMTDDAEPGSVAFSPDNSTVFAAIGNTVRRWDAFDGRPGGTIVTHPSQITGFRLSANGKMLASVSFGFQKPAEVRVTILANGRELLRRSPDPDGFQLWFDQPRIAFSPDDRLLIMSGSDQSIEAYEMTDGHMAYRIQKEGAIGETWQLAPDGSRLIANTGGDKNQVIGWDGASGQERFHFADDLRRKLVVAPDRRAFYLASKRMFAEMRPIDEFDLDSGKLQRTIPDTMYDFAAMSGDGKTLALADSQLREQVPTSPKIRLRNLPSGKALQEFRVSPFANAELRRRYLFSPDLRTFAMLREGKATFGCGTGSGGVFFGDSCPTLFDLHATANGKVVVHRQYPPLVEEQCKFSPNGRHAVNWGHGPSICVWDAENGECASIGHEGKVLSADLAPDGKTIVSLDTLGLVCAWNSASGRRLRELPVSDLHVTSVRMSPNGQILATLEERDNWVETVSLWEFATGKRIARFARKFRGGFQGIDDPHLDTLAFHSDGSLSVAGHSRKGILLWSIDISKIVARAPAKPAESPIEDGLADAMPLDDWAQRKEITRADSGGLSEKLCFSTDGRYLAQVVLAKPLSGLWLYDLSTDKCVFELPDSARVGRIHQFAIAPSGDKLAFVGEQGTTSLEVWNIASRQRISRLAGWSNNVGAMTFSPNGRQLAIGTGVISGQPMTKSRRPTPTVTQSEIELVDATNANVLARVLAHDGAITSLAFSMDGLRLVSGASDSTILLWDVASMMAIQKQLPK